jgi:hypothetical protein
MAVTKSWPRILLTIGSLVPYWQLLTFSVLFIPDDHFTSDLYNGELPGRLIVARLIRGGEWPLWTPQICSGYPLDGAPADPIGLLLFTLFSPAAALDALLIVLLLVAAHGTYTLARRFGAEATGAVLAGIAFAGSGYFVSQLKHLSILSTVAWIPFGLVLVDRIFTPAENDGEPDARRRRTLHTALLGLLYANQVLSGFPQAAYISGLVYGAFAVFRILSGWRLWPAKGWLLAFAGFAGALVLGAAAGAIVLLPLADFTTVSDRVAPLDYRWATYTHFWPRNFFTFFFPYINGDPTNGTYVGPFPFWENYGYAGFATVLLAVYGAFRERRRASVAFLILMTLIAFAFILGPRTPIYYAAFTFVPGMNAFRAPTRFMVLVDLGLVLLAAIGLTRLRAAPWVKFAIGAVTVLDLLIYQPRWNPMVPAREWLAAPSTAQIVARDSPAPRTFTPHHRDIHRAVHDRNSGWRNLEPYFRLRALLEPNLGGGYWNVPSADCYVGLMPRWYVTVWSYHYFENSLISELAFQEVDRGVLSVKPGFSNLLATFGVTHVLSPYPAEDRGLTLAAQDRDAYVYRVEGAARVRIVQAARRVLGDAEAVAYLRNPTFNPEREVLLLDAPQAVQAPVVTGSDALPADGDRAVIAREGARQLVIDTRSSRDGFLLLADMYYPGWTARVDGVATQIYRANVSTRAIALPKGQHTVEFIYEPSAFFRGLKISLAALAALVLWTGAAVYRLHA